VTVARAREPLDLRAWLAGAPAWSSPAWRVDAVDVMASELAPAARSTPLVARCPLAG
jgi:hypothetical protein